MTFDDAMAAWRNSSLVRTPTCARGRIARVDIEYRDQYHEVMVTVEDLSALYRVQPITERVRVDDVEIVAP